MARGLSPSLFAAALIGASQIALVWLAPGLTHDAAKSLSAVIPLILLLALPAALSLWLGSHLARSARSGAEAMSAVFLFGLFIRLVWIGSPAPIEDDYQRYLWDGALVAHGLDPYALSPAEALRGLAAGTLPPPLAELAREGAGTLARVNFPELRSLYPGAAQAAFALAHWLTPWSLDGLRLVFLLADAAAFLLLAALLRRSGASPLWSALYWCNPFVSAMLIGAAHVDALLPPLVLGALLAVASGRAAAAAGLLGVAAGVKLWPALLIPLALRPLLASPRRLIAPAVVAGLAICLTLAPLFRSALGENSGLAAYAGGWSNNNALFAWALLALRQVAAEADAQLALRAFLATVACGVALCAAIRPWRDVRELGARALAIAAAVFFCSPAQFPWYAAWFLPLAALVRFWPLLWASALLPSYYLFFPLWGTPHHPLFAHGVALLHAAPLIGWMLWRAAMSGPNSRRAQPRIGSKA